MSQSHVIKGGAADEAFQEPCFLRERGASLTFFFFYFQDIPHAQIEQTLKERNKKWKKYDGSPFNNVTVGVTDGNRQSPSFLL